MTDRTDDGRLRGWRAALVWGVIAADLAFAFGVWLAAGAGPDTPAYGPLIFAALVASLGGVGGLVATRKPRDPVGWILWVSATMVTIAISGADYVRLSLSSFDGGLPATVPIAWLQGIVFLPAAILVVGVVPLYFPDGALISRRWRWAVGLAAAGIVVVALPSAFTPGLLANTSIENPLGITGFDGLAGLLGLANLLLTLLVLPLAIASCVLKYRRGAAMARQQIKWFAAAALWTVLSFMVAVVGVAPVSDVGWLFGLLGLVLIPIAIGIAILRYRLYEIDRIVSRTVGYAIVSLVLVAVFAGVVLLLTAVLAPLTGDNTLAVAGSTLVVAALFQPLRRRVQHGVDRRFDRARYDGERLSVAFVERLRDEMDLGSVTSDLLVTTRAALVPASIGIWVREPEVRR